MIELYASPTPNVLKINIMLEEIEAPYEIRRVDVWRGEQFGEKFLELNPNSKVPVIVDREGPDGGACTVFESGAILFYLAEKSGRFLPRAQQARYETMQWLMFQMAGLGPMAGQFNHFHVYAPEGNDYSRSRYATEMKRLYGVIERRLATVPFIAGTEYSIADMAIFPWIRIQARRFGADFSWMRADLPGGSAIGRWFEVVSQRPAVQRALRAFDTIGSTLQLATADQLDRVFGRGQYALGNQPL